MKYYNNLKLTQFKINITNEWGELLYFPVIWSWSLAFLSLLVNNLLHIQYFLLDWNLWPSIEMTDSY